MGVGTAVIVADIVVVVVVAVGGAAAPDTIAEAIPVAARMGVEIGAVMPGKADLLPGEARFSYRVRKMCRRYSGRDSIRHNRGSAFFTLLIC
jgi:hypothetical protein